MARKYWGRTCVAQAEGGEERAGALHSSRVPTLARPLPRHVSLSAPILWASGIITHPRAGEERTSKGLQSSRQSTQNTKGAQ